MRCFQMRGVLIRKHASADGRLHAYKQKKRKGHFQQLEMKPVSTVRFSLQGEGGRGGRDAGGFHRQAVAICCSTIVQQQHLSFV